MNDVIFDFLHMEIVQMFTSNTGTDEHDNMDVVKLEQIGFQTGYRLIEKIAKDIQRFKDELDIMKYICKDFWSLVFKKQINNLKTNHQGIYVLLDNKFRFLVNMSESKQYIESIPKFLAFTCGLIRGSLQNLGLLTVVTAEVVHSPIVRFQVQVQRS